MPGMNRLNSVYRSFDQFYVMLSVNLAKKEVKLTVYEWKKRVSPPQFTVYRGEWNKYGVKFQQVLSKNERETRRNWFRLRVFILLIFLFGDGLGDFCSDKDEKRVGESGFTAGEPWPGEEPVRPGVGPDQEKKHSV